MKIAKPTERDLDAAGKLLSLIDGLSDGYLPHIDGDRGGDDDDETDFQPERFDPDDKQHLRTLYDAIRSLSRQAPGYVLRVIGGMSYAIMYDKNEIVDPASDTLELHPRIKKALALLDASEAAASSTPASPDAAPETVVKCVEMLSDEQRIDLFRRFCKHCGSNNPRCHCSNDE